MLDTEKKTQKSIIKKIEKMAYDSLSLNQILEKIQRGHVCMPSIQRKYVWGIEKIEKLFDSLFLGYPIGTFLIWDLPEGEYPNYVFYKIKNDYNKDNGKWQEKREEVRWDAQTWALLDGQQRLTSLCIGFTGSYSFSRKNSDKHIRKYLYFNLCPKNETNEEEYANFKFLEEDAALNDSNNIWIKVKHFVTTLKEFASYQYGFEFNNYTAIIEDINRKPFKNEFIQDILNNCETVLPRKIGPRIFNFADLIHNVDKKIFNYYLIKTKSLDTCTEIFVRINSGGQALSRADLLFSTVISKWESGRELIDQVINDVNKIGFTIDSDFIMRTCLYVTNSPILFDVNNFTDETIEKIIEAFSPENKLDTAIKKTFIFLKEKLRLTKSNLKSNNVVIPIIHHYYECKRFSEISSSEIKKYITISLLRKIFGNHGDSLLKNLRDSVTDSNGNYKFKESNFNFKIIISKIKEDSKRELFNINSIWIDKILDFKKGHYSLLVLSLVYDNLQHEYSKYDQDHIHPKSKFKAKEYLAPEGYKAGMEDTVANLGFLTPEDNRKSKRAKLLTEYLSEIEKTKYNWFIRYKEFNKIDENIDLDLSNFIEFYNKRRQKLKEILIEKLGVTDNPNSPDLNDDNYYDEPEEPDLDDPDPDLFSIENQDIDDEPEKPDLDAPDPDLFSIENQDIDDQPEENNNETVEKEKNLISSLYSELSSTSFQFLKGRFSTTEIYDAVKSKYPELCNDNYLCKDNCKNGHNGAEWKHRVRAALANLKSKGIIIHDKEEKKYEFTGGL